MKDKPQTATDADWPPAYIVGVPHARNTRSVLHREADGVSIISPSCTIEEAQTMALALNARFYPAEVTDDELAAFVHRVEALATCIMPLPPNHPIRAEKCDDPIAQRKTLTLLLAALRGTEMTG